MFYVEKQRYVDLGEPERRELKTKLGRCRRYAPTMKGYPVVYSSDWCGEHKIGSNPVRDEKEKAKIKREIIDILAFATVNLAAHNKIVKLLEDL